jgi:hypothetical protein
MNVIEIPNCNNERPLRSPHISASGVEDLSVRFLQYRYSHPFSKETLKEASWEAEHDTQRTPRYLRRAAKRPLPGSDGNSTEISVFESLRSLLSISFDKL